MKQPLLLYHQELRATSQLIEGRLLLIDSDEITNTYIACSGQPSHQSSGSVATRGRGPIPSSLDVTEKYTVATLPISLPNVQGVSGNFYKINPHFVKINGVQRGDFGIHFDANVPGSAGCVVIRNRDAWAHFQEEMKSLAKLDIKQIPLLVSYAR